MKFRTIFIAVLVMLGFIAVSPQAEAAIVANNTCPNSNFEASWDNGHTYAYLTNANITVAPTWCAGNPTYNNRIVWQPNGDLTVWSGAHSGGTLLWHSGTGNQGATQLRFQGEDGNIVIYKAYPSQPIWSSGAWGNCYPYWHFYLAVFTGHSLVDSLVTGNACRTSSQNRLLGTF